MDLRVPFLDRFPGNDLSNSHIWGYDGQFFPHRELHDAIYHVCFRLNDSVPQHLIREWMLERERMMEVLKMRGELNSADISSLQYFFSGKIEKYIDNGYGSCIFRDERYARIMQDIITSRKGTHYELYAWCIMPNHIHALISLLGGNNLSKVVGAWKSYSAHVLNRQRGVKGHLWHEDFFNRIIRTADDYDRVKMYIWNNPDNAGLHKWPWRWITHNEQMMEGQR